MVVFFNMAKLNTVIEVTILNIFHDSFDYLPVQGLQASDLKLGMRIKVPLRNKVCIGIIVNIKNNSQINAAKLKRAIALVDNHPIINTKLLKLYRWAADYYQYPLSRVYQTALPRLLRLGHPAISQQETIWVLVPKANPLPPSPLKLTPKQIATLNLLNKYPEGIGNYELLSQGIKSRTLQSLLQKGVITTKTGCFTVKPSPAKALAHPPNFEQQKAIETISNSFNAFNCFLLYGITGSGKTEIYLQCAQKVIQKKQQILILVPEIGLTPQIFNRFQTRFKLPIALIHSNLTDRQRLDAYLLASSGKAPIIIGTRSAIFTPTATLAIIIIDEEHDPSFKQQEGFRYSARDLAVMRAQMEAIPIVLGSATPSLESLHNVEHNKYQLLRLGQRASGNQTCQFKLIDCRNQTLEQGISKPLLNDIQKHLLANNQVLLFINRRGYAPILMCHQCAWIAPCPHCDSYLTFHWQVNYLLCHHCLYKRRLPEKCSACNSTQFIYVGTGTQRVEAALKSSFPTTPILRIDRDNVRHKGSLVKMLKEIEMGGAKILIGTQMLTKGHHFPNLTLVGILDADSGFFSQEFHASERLGQLLIQVAGRAGRAEKPGEVIIQTHMPHHPLLNKLLKHGYTPYAKTLLAQRRASDLPPYSSLALFRSEAAVKENSIKVLNEIKRLFSRLPSSHYQLLGPIPAPMEKRKNLFHAQLLLQTKSRRVRQQILKRLRLQLFSLKKYPQAKWSIDVDPIEMF